MSRPKSRAAHPSAKETQRAAKQRGILPPPEQAQYIVPVAMLDYERQLAVLRAQVAALMEERDALRRTLDRQGHRPETD